MDLKHQVKENWKVVIASAAAFAIGSASLGVANAGDDRFDGVRSILLQDRVQVDDDARESGVQVITAEIESLNDSPDAENANDSPATEAAADSPDDQVADDSPDHDSPDTQAADDSPDQDSPDTQVANDSPDQDSPDDSPDAIDSPDNS